jgi:hypothetical protein
MLVEDFTVYFADFGVNATLNGTTVRAIFDNGYAVGTVGMMGVSTSGPQLRLDTSDVPANPVGKPVVVAGLNFTVAVHDPDGTGLSTLHLEEVP